LTEELDLVVTRGPHPMHVRVRAGLRKSKNWRQLAKFCIVGGSGYVVNLCVFALCVGPFGTHHLLAATIAFVAGVTNNFWWNRHWTFRAKAGRADSQASRFFAVSVVAFLFALAVLELLVSVMDMAELPAQAIAIVAATPLNFVGNKMWSFAIEVSRD
jgi:dolichol-phosphate mannosyltransferase